VVRQFSGWVKSASHWVWASIFYTSIADQENTVVSNAEARTTVQGHLEARKALYATEPVATEPVATELVATEENVMEL
jgi:hypothetical protein